MEGLELLVLIPKTTKDHSKIKKALRFQHLCANYSLLLTYHKQEIINFLKLKLSSKAKKGDKPGPNVKSFLT